MGNQIEGYYQTEKQVVVIEDLISTGKSRYGLLSALRTAGLQIAGDWFHICTYGFDEAAKKAFSAEGIKTRSLTDYSTLIRLAVEKGSVNAAQHETLVKWREDPCKLESRFVFLKINYIV
jgi:orotate phosphoribosyltransferase